MSYYFAVAGWLECRQDVSPELLMRIEEIDIESQGFKQHLRCWSLGSPYSDWGDRIFYGSYMRADVLSAFESSLETICSWFEDCRGFLFAQGEDSQLNVKYVVLDGKIKKSEKVNPLIG